MLRFPQAVNSSSEFNSPLCCKSVIYPKEIDRPADIHTKTMKLECTQTQPVLIEKQTDNLNLHWTSSVAAWEIFVPSLLFATHRYSPLSALLIFVIVNSLLSSPRLIRGTLLFNTDPSLVHVIVGKGSPLALQDKVTLSPSVTGSTWGCVVITSATIIKKQN